MRIALPVLEDRAEVVYHSEQRRTKRVVAATGNVTPSKDSGTACRDVCVDSDGESNDQYLDRSLWRLDNLAGLIVVFEWKGREAALELASQALPPFTRCFPVGTFILL